jgi:NitT/TauT family transport system substrate-binding protein
MQQLRRLCILVLSISIALADDLIPEATAEDIVNVGVFRSISDAGIYIAADKGYFAEQGLKVLIQNVDSSSTVTTGLASGDLDVSGGSPAASIYNAVRQGVPIVIVADKGCLLVGYGYLAFMVRTGLADKVKTAADLRELTLAATGYFAGASNEVTIQHLLQPEGVEARELKIVSMSFPDILAALGTGAVDVGTLIEPLVTVAVDKGVATIWKRGDQVYPSQQYSALIYGPGIVKRPDVAKRFMMAYLKGVRFYNDALTGKTPRGELIAILTKNTSVTNATLYDRMAFPGLNPNGALNIEGMREDMKWFVAAGRMKEAVDMHKVVDTSYIEAAVSKLGEYK